MTYSRLRSVLATLILGTFPAQLAEATIVEKTNAVLVPYSESSAENGVAGFAVAWGSSFSSPCSGNVFYVAPEDKQILAEMLSAQIAGIEVTFRYDDSAPTVTLGSFSGATTQCKIVSVYIQKTSY